ncbi:hypothetical protein [Peribacillus simplex]|nr:hypothetical protein [Peribacillus simplex]
MEEVLAQQLEEQEKRIAAKLTGIEESSKRIEDHLTKKSWR